MEQKSFNSMHAFTKKITITPVKWAVAVNVRTHGTTCTDIVDPRQCRRGTAPRVAKQSSQTFFHIPLQSPRYGAPELHAGFHRRSKFSKHTEASSALCTHPSSQPMCAPSKVLSTGWTRTSDGAKTQNRVVSKCFSQWSTDVTVSGCTILTNGGRSPKQPQQANPLMRAPHRIACSESSQAHELCVTHISGPLHREMAECMFTAVRKRIQVL